MSRTVESGGRRRPEEMKFAYAGPFHPVLDPIRAVKPMLDRLGVAVSPQPRYAATSGERYDIESAIGRTMADYLAYTFGREREGQRAGRQRRSSRRTNERVTKQVTS